MSSERRRFDRINQIIGIEFTGVTHGMAMTRDISTGGVLFLSAEPLAPGTTCIIRIPFEDGVKPMEMDAKIVRCERQQFGCAVAAEFNAMNDSLRQALDNYIRNYSG